MRAPSRWWYAVGTVVALGGAIAIVVVGFVGFMTAMDDMDRVAIPGERELALQPGDYVGYYEYRSHVDGEMFQTTEEISGLRCALDGAAGPVELQPPSVSGSYETGSYAGRSLFAFSIAEPGHYRLRCDHDGDHRLVIAIGGGIASVAGIALMIGGVFLCIGVGAGIMLWTWSRRRRSA